MRLRRGQKPHLAVRVVFYLYVSAMVLLSVPSRYSPDAPMSLGVSNSSVFHNPSQVPEQKAQVHTCSGTVPSIRTLLKVAVRSSGTLMRLTWMCQLDYKNILQTRFQLASVSTRLASVIIVFVITLTEMHSQLQSLQKEDDILHHSRFWQTKSISKDAKSDCIRGYRCKTFILV